MIDSRVLWALGVAVIVMIVAIGCAGFLFPAKPA